MKTIKALLMKPGGETSLVDLPNSGDQSLKARQTAVGGNIEGVYFGSPYSDQSDGIMWLNEEGKYTLGPDHYNGNATDLVRHALMFGDWICGTVLIVGEGRGGNDGDVPQWVIDQVRAFPDCRWIDSEGSNK